MEKKIKEILNTISPVLTQHGGNVEFIKYENNKAYVKLVGNCSNCPMANQTLKNLIENTLMFEIPEITEVINIQE